MAGVSQLTSLNLFGCEKLTEGTGEAEEEEEQEEEEQEEEGQEDIQPLQNLGQLTYLNLSCCSWLTSAFRRS